MSTSCVRRSVLRWISRTPLSYETVPAAPPTARELDAYRDGADRFIAELDEEYYLHFAGLKDTLELEPIYERHADLTTLEQAQALGAAADGSRGARELWRFACEGYLGDLTRDHDRSASPSSRPSSTRRSTARRFRSGCCGSRWRTSPTAPGASGSSSSATSSTRRAPEPDSPRGRRSHAAARSRRSARRRTASSTSSSASGSTTSPSSAARSSTSTERAVRARRRPALPRARRRRARRGAALGRRPRVPRARLGLGVPGGPDAARTRGDARATSGSTCARRRTSTSTSSSARTRRPRAFCAPIEVPDQVMLVIQPIGGADDWRALFHEAGHTEHFAHTSRRAQDRGAAPRRQRRHRGLGDAAAST